MASALRYLGALAAIGGVSALASQANATITTINYGGLTPGTDNHYDIYLAGSYEYTYFNNTQQHAFDCGPKCSGTHTNVDEYIFNGLNAQFGDTTTIAGLPSLGESFHDDFIHTYTETVTSETNVPDTVFESGLASGDYIHLKFNAGGTDYLGTAHFTNGFHPGLDFIEYDTLANVQAASAGVPEPEVWALLIAGFGLAGAGLRRRRAQMAA